MKKQKRKDIFIKYPRIPNLETMNRPNARILLGKYLNWTFKRDGSNLAFWMKSDGTIQISSRNMKVASSDLQNLAKQTEEYPKIVNLVKDFPELQVHAELCRKGRSVTGIENFDHTFLIVFDILNRTTRQFLPYINTHQYCFHYGIPIVKLYATTRHRSMKDLLKFRNHVLEYCKAMSLEGMVIKTFGEYNGKRLYLQAKVKLDVPRPIKKKIARGEPIYPPIPYSETMSCIDKAFQDLGREKFKNKKIAMPLIAKYIKEACKQHLYSSPKKKLYVYYLEYIERLL